MTSQTTTHDIDDEPTGIYRGTPDLPDATIEALRELAIEEGDVRVAELASEALRPRMQSSAEAARVSTPAPRQPT